MRLDIRSAGNADLNRILELVNRPNQLAQSYGEEDLKALLSSSEHACWLVSLRDRFGDCGAVGFLLMELAPQSWTLQLALFSCRVASRDVDVIVLSSLLRKARAAGVGLRALFKHSSRNESLWLAYQRAGFVETGRCGDLIVAAHRLERLPPYPCPAELIFHGV
jgi:FkbH-like protein